MRKILSPCVSSRIICLITVVWNISPEFSYDYKKWCQKYDNKQLVYKIWSMKWFLDENITTEPAKRGLKKNKVSHI